MPSSLRAERALDVLNVVLADVRYGLGPYGAIYLMAEHGWDEASLALAYSFGGIVGLLSQAPLGAAVDAVRAKRALLAGAVLAVAASCLLIVLVPRFWPVAAAGIVAALAGNTLLLTVAAISLGIVGPTRFARRAGRNEALFHAGNACINLAILATAPLFGLAAVFWALAATVLASATAVLAIPAEAIDYAVARGLPPDAATHGLRPSALGVLLASRPLLVFAGCGALFHLANASLLALVVQRATRADPAGAVAFAAACMITAQLTMVATAALAAARADAWGRRPFFLAAFAAVVLRAGLNALSDSPVWTVSAQLLDGVGVGVFGALFPVVVADLTRGSGRFNAAQGSVGMVHSVGGLLSGLIANLVVVWASYSTAFLLLATIAALGGTLFWLVMPETRSCGAGGLSQSATDPSLKG
jgi:predicted MFS family arabinose efflux permease